MKRLVLFLISIFAFQTLVGATGKPAIGNTQRTTLDEGDTQIPFMVSVGSNAATAAPWNSYDDYTKASIRAILIQNPNSTAVMFSTWSGFGISNPHGLIPGSTGSITINNAADIYFKEAPGVSTDNVKGIVYLQK